MKRILTLIILLITSTIIVNGQCVANYSYSGTTDTINFTNLSTVSNPHFYWNFGDGSGSNDFSPIHIFPDDGKYLVTLYSLDTMSNCVDIKQNWIDVVKPDTFACNILFTDTIIGTLPQTNNLSTGCSGLYLNCHVFTAAQNMCSGFTLGTWFSSLFLHGMESTSNDSIYGYRIYNSYYKTIPYHYLSSTNYQDCSANFEVLIDYQPTYATATFTAMNKNATNYTFYVTGYGSPIPLYGKSVSFNFNYITYAKVFPWNVYLITSDVVNNCADSVNQTILIKNPYYSYPVNCEINSPPQIQSTTIGSNVQFYILTSSNAQFQWQQDAGLGYVNLTNAGPYSGVTTDTLSIANVPLTMNNFNYRCVVYDSISGGWCHNTSSSAALYVTGINELELANVKIYPNPATNNLTVDLPTPTSKTTATIYDVLGARHQLVVLDRQQTNIDISSLACGIYFIEVTADNKVRRQMFVKQ